MNAPADRTLPADTRRDWEFSDTFDDAIRRIVGPHLLVPSPMELDCKQATDFTMVFRAATDVMVAARIRREASARQYPNEFTLRSWRRTGAQTELAKVISGWGDLLLYGHEDPSEPGQIGRWLLIDLDVFRDLWDGGWFGVERMNRDGRTAFRAFDITEVPGRGLVIASDRRPQLRRCS